MILTYCPWLLTALKNNNSITAATLSNSSTKSTSSNHLTNPNKITITRRSVHSVSTSTNSSSISSCSSSSSGSNSGKSNTSYIKNCLIRSSSCSNTVTNVTTLAQIMSNSSTSSAASLLNQHNNNSNCSNSSNFSTASSVGSSISVGSNSSSSNCSNGSNSNSNDSNSSSGGGHRLSFKGTGRHVPASGLSSSAASTNTNGTVSGIGGIISVEAPRKNRPKLSSPTRHGPQQCQVRTQIRCGFCGTHLSYILNIFTYIYSVYIRGLIANLSPLILSHANMSRRQSCNIYKQTLRSSRSSGR